MVTKHICPTCELEQPEGREPLRYFAQSQSDWPSADNVDTLYEDTYRVLRFLGAVAQAIRLDPTEEEEENQWMPWLAEELAKETERRLLRLREAGFIWQKRATPV